MKWIRSAITIIVVTYQIFLKNVNEFITHIKARLVEWFLRRYGLWYLKNNNSDGYLWVRDDSNEFGACIQIMNEDFRHWCFGPGKNIYRNRSYSRTSQIRNTPSLPAQFIQRHYKDRGNFAIFGNSVTELNRVELISSTVYLSKQLDSS